MERARGQIPTEVLGRVGAPSTAVCLGKILWVRVDTDTDTLWARMDHVFSNQGATEVLVEQRWEPFDVVKNEYLRFLLPFDHTIELVFRKDVGTTSSLDDYEPEELNTRLEDQTLPLRILQPERPQKKLDEGKIMKAWKSEYGEGRE